MCVGVFKAAISIDLHILLIRVSAEVQEDIEVNSSNLKKVSLGPLSNLHKY